ncbi:MAG: NAD(P)H-dependent glycerol-3-phosphate dehydrogenase, partial [Comamonas sp.]
MKILVIGAGAWGTAMAISAATHPDKRVVSLWARDPAQAQLMQAERANSRYLPGITFPEPLAVVSGDVMAHAAAADLIVLGTPMAALRQWLGLLKDCSVPVVWLCKGFEAVSADAAAGSYGLMAHEVCQQVAPQLQSGALSGPSFAAEVARQQPTALVAASAHEGVSELLVSAFHGDAMRVYANHDIVGVEVGGAVKNVLAIATGL